MCDCDLDEELAILKTNSDKTHVLVNTIKVLRKKDFEKMMGSGLIVSIRDLTGRNVTDTFMMRAEDMQGIAPLIVASLVESLKLRRVLLASELKEVTEAIG